MYMWFGIACRLQPLELPVPETNLTSNMADLDSCSTLGKQAPSLGSVQHQF